MLPRITASWRAATTTNLVTMHGMIAQHVQTVLTAEAFNVTSPLNDATNEVPWPLETSRPGVYTGTFGYQRCDDFPGCPQAEPADSVIPFGAAWPDGRRKTQPAFDVFFRVWQP